MITFGAMSQQSAGSGSTANPDFTYTPLTPAPSGAPVKMSFVGLAPCPSGSFYDPLNQCRVPCPTDQGFLLNTNGLVQCRSCGGQGVANGYCNCPSGQALQPNGSCALPKQQVAFGPQVTCPTDQVMGPYGCQWVPCPGTQIRDTKGVCVANQLFSTGGGQTPAGQAPPATNGGGSGGVPGYTPGPSCPSGYYWNTVACVPNTSSGGYAGLSTGTDWTKIGIIGGGVAALVALGYFFMRKA